MERDDLAIDGLLRELARVPEGEDHAFVSRVLARTRKPTLPRAPILAAAAILFAMGLFLALMPAAPTVRIVAAQPSCVTDAAGMRLLVKDPATGNAIVASGQVQIGFQQVSELLPIKGIDFVGPLPADIQLRTVFSAGTHVGATRAEAARTLTA